METTIVQIMGASVALLIVKEVFAFILKLVVPSQDKKVVEILQRQTIILDEMHMELKQQNERMAEVGRHLAIAMERQKVSSAMISDIHKRTMLRGGAS